MWQYSIKGKGYKTVYIYIYIFMRVHNILYIYESTMYAYIQSIFQAPYILLKKPPCFGHFQPAGT